MTRGVALVAALVALLLVPFSPHADGQSPRPCSGFATTCPSPVADRVHGTYHGLIAITGDASFLQREQASTGSEGCSDCIWTLVIDCQMNQPGTGSQVECGSAQQNPQCHRGQLAEKLFLSRPGHGFGMVGVYCIGGGNRIVPIGDIARADVERYLKDVKPPSLDITFDPGTSLSGLATRVRARPDRRLRAVPFGGQGVTETIKLAPVRQVWRWGDGQTATFTAATVRTTHTYVRGGHLTATVTTTWGATYTITYQGLTLGPYDATGQLTGQQSRPVTVVTSTPVLISHG